MNLFCPETKLPKKNTFVLLSLFCIALLGTAWLSDDSAITLRTVLNFLHGFGPNFNSDERVQAYTHPLWFLLITALTIITGNIFVAVFFLCISCSLLTLWFLLRYIARDYKTMLLALAILLLSKAYLDFSTSGLENSLSHLLIVLGVIQSLSVLENKTQTQPTPCLMTFALLYLSRPDLILLVLPIALLILYLSYRTFKQLCKTLFIISIDVSNNRNCGSQI